jgi:transglycosylase-like protein
VAYVRKLIVAVVALFLVSVPAALAATRAAQPDSGIPKLVAPKLIDRHLLRSEASAKLRAARERAKRKAERRQAIDVPPQLQAIAQCESHGNPRSIGGGGQYRGKYQMTYSIWASVGGEGDPAAAPEPEQDRRAAMLYERSGPGQWPVCGQ